MKNIRQFTKKVNNVAYKSECMIEICTNQTMHFSYRKHFVAQVILKLHLARNVFDFFMRV